MHSDFNVHVHICTHTHTHTYINIYEVIGILWLLHGMICLIWPGEKTGLVKSVLLDF